MNAIPEAALALWNDVDPARDAEYEHWHSTEHAPERVWVPGFLRATRYARHVGAGPRYFTLYEIRTIDALGSPEYRELVQRPTPWSASMRPSMSGFVRKPLVLSALAGAPPRGAASGLVTVRAVWNHPPEAWNRQLGELIAHLQEAAPDASRVAGGWVADAGPQAIANVQDAPPGHEAVIWAELEAEADETRLAARRDELVRRIDAMAPAPLWRCADGYRLLTRIERAHAAGSPRPSPRTDLMNRYHGDNT